jgi:hypothetical protein
MVPCEPSVRPLFPILALLAACHAREPARPAVTTGAIAGIVRDSVTGEPYPAVLAAHGQDSLEAHGARVGDDGVYRIADLPPGIYDLAVELEIAGTSMQFTGIPVVAGLTTGFDVPVDPAHVEMPPQPFARVESDAIVRFTPDDLDPSVGRLQGVVTDVVTRERAVAVVVFATSPAVSEALTTVSDDAGHFEIGDVPPGTYELSAYYTVPRRGQIEVKRSGVEVAAGSAVHVPIYVEFSGQN